MPMVNVSKLEGAALDWAVAKANGASQFYLDDYALHGEHRHISPSNDWSLAGPIIERERIGVAPYGSKPEIWKAVNTVKFSGHFYGATLLIAAMRCYVASKLGEAVDIPEELI